MICDELLFYGTDYENTMENCVKNCIILKLVLKSDYIIVMIHLNYNKIYPRHHSHNINHKPLLYVMYDNNVQIIQQQPVVKEEEDSNKLNINKHKLELLNQWNQHKNIRK